jgi:hypothetical protein
MRAKIKMSDSTNMKYDPIILISGDGDGDYDLDGTDVTLHRKGDNFYLNGRKFTFDPNAISLVSKKGIIENVE